MNFIKVLLTLFFLISLNACCTKKNNTPQVKENVEESKVSNDDELIKSGYKKAYIVFNDQKDDPCKYLIQIDDYLLLEPLQELENNFKISDLSVWVKYHPQRRMSRCANSQPIEIIDIKAR